MDIPVPTLQEQTEKVLHLDPERQAIEWGETWYTWGQLRAVADGVRACLKASGADPRAPVAFLPRNRPGSIAALFGLVCESRDVQMIHVYQSAEAIAHDLALLHPAVVVAMASDYTPEVLAVLHAEGIAGVAVDGLSVAPCPGLASSTIASPVRPGEPQFELLTSGTTGPPKRFALSYSTLCEHMVLNNIFGTQGVAESATMAPVFDPLLFSTIGGLYFVLPTLLHGIRITLADRFELKAWHRWLIAYRPQMAGLPPAAIQMIMEAEIPREDLASIACVSTGAAPLDPTLQKAFEDRYGIPVLLSYGATEFGGPVTQNTLNLRREWGSAKYNSVGRGFGGAELRVVDAATGEVLAAGAEGVLEVMAPRMGRHWIRTTDQGLIDSDGFVFIKGRADGAINRGGFKMLPDDIERALQRHPAVAAAAVIGLADKRLGEVPAAAIVVDRRQPRPAIAELEAHLRQHLPATHVPAQWRFVEQLPYTSMMKVDRFALAGLFRDGA